MTWWEKTNSQSYSDIKPCMFIRHSGGDVMQATGQSQEMLTLEFKM